MRRSEGHFGMVPVVGYGLDGVQRLPFPVAPIARCVSVWSFTAPLHGERLTPKALYPTAQGRVLAHPGKRDGAECIYPEGVGQADAASSYRTPSGYMGFGMACPQGARVRDPGLRDTTPSA